MLKLENIKYLYNEKAIDGLHGIDLTINAGEVIGLMGPSGCGKSTLAKLIAGSIKPSSGGVESQFESSLYLHESLLLHNKTVLENFTKYAHGDTQDQKITKARMACSDLEITNYIQTSISHLSTGQLQRVLLGIAIVSEAPLVILDEPFSHLEQSLRHELTQIMLPFFAQNNTAILWISHDQDLLMSHCEKVMIMNYGKVLQSSTPEDLYFKPNNLFTADFLGTCNKELLKDGLSQVWQKSFPSEGTTPLLLIRPEAILISDNGIEAELIDSRFNGSGYMNIFDVNGIEVKMKTHMKLNQPAYKLSYNQELIKVLPNF